MQSTMEIRSVDTDVFFFTVLLFHNVTDQILRCIFAHFPCSGMAQYLFPQKMAQTHACGNWQLQNFVYDVKPSKMDFT